MIWKNWPQTLELCVLKQLCKSTKNSFKSRSRCVICPKLSFDSNFLLSLDLFPPRKLQLNKNIVLPVHEIRNPVEGPDFDWIFPVKSILQEEPHKENALGTKPMLLTDSWCLHENMNQGIFLPLCKGWDMAIQAPSHALNGGAEDPAQAGTRTWRELPCRVPRSHSRIVMLPSLDCPSFTVCDHGSVTHHPPRPNFMLQAWAEIYILYRNRTLSVTWITGNKACFKWHLDKPECIQGWSKEQTFNY